MPHQVLLFLQNNFLHLSETALKLDTLVGDIEDTVSSAMNKNMRKLSSTQSSEVCVIHLFSTLIFCSKDCFFTPFIIFVFAGNAPACN